MANISLDTLYDLYQREENSFILDNMLKTYVKGCDYGAGVLLEAKNYIKNNLGMLPSFYKSEQMTKEQGAEIKELIAVINRLAYALDNYQADLREDVIKKIQEEDPNYESLDAAGRFLPTHVFKFSPERIGEAYRAYYNEIYEVTPEAFAKVASLVKLVKSDGALEKIYGDNSWEDLPIEDVIYSLFDYYNKDSGKFKVETEGFFEFDKGEDILNDYFANIRNGKSENGIDFTRYRPSLIIKNTMTSNLDKLIFARNILDYKRSGVMPSKNGYIDFFVDEEEADNLSDTMHHLYNKSFDNQVFRNYQSNPIFSAEKTLRRPKYVEDCKSIRKGNSLAIGVLLSSVSSPVTEYVRQFYLMHIYIDDISVNKGKYEIQFNVIPEADLYSRIQLIRLDNYFEMGTHKNVGTKLDTITHVHLYNHFDIIRGKTNGAYDIAYNFDEKSNNFEDSLDALLRMMGAREELKDSITKKVLKIKKEAEKHVVREM